TRQILIVQENVASAHDPQTGAVLWDYPWPGTSNTNANCSQPQAVGQDQVLLSKGYGGGGELLRISRDDKGWDVASVWSNHRALRTKFSNVAIRGHHAYGLDDLFLMCVDLETGKPTWKGGRYRYGQILLVGDHLLVLGERGELALVEAAPNRFTELHRIQVFQGQTWNTLCLYRDRLLLRNSEEAVCYELAAELQ
ncbi:MAG TPA: hypothetical protein VIY86_03020, partial [Pirellulaceae bacterium]